MKKIFCLVSAFIMTLSWFSVQPSQAADSPIAKKVYEAALQLTRPAQTEDSAAAINAYTAVLQNKMTFYNITDKKNYRLKELKDESGDPLEVKSFAVVDMDSNEKLEVVLDFDNAQYGVMVLHYEDGLIYGFNISYTYYLANDGTYIGTLPAWCLSYCKITSIAKDKYTETTLARVDVDPNKEGAKTFYYINESEVTEDRHHAFVQSLGEKREGNEAVWHDFTDANIASVFPAAYAQEALPATSASLTLTDPAALKYATILNSYWDYFIHRNNDDAIDDLFARLAKEVKIETDTNIPKAYGLKNSFEPLAFASSGINFGYSLRDLNNDGIPELFIISANYSIHALYSLVNGNPVILGGYWSRNRCEVDENGIFYKNGSSGAEDSSFASYSYVGGHELRLIRMVGMESYDEKSGKSLASPRYFQIEKGKKTIISGKEAEADPLWDGIFPKDNALDLNFVPLFSIPPAS